jgi:antitoxin PrlF
MIATVTAKGQVTLPVEARRRLGLGPGSKLEFVVVDDERLEAIPVSETVSSLKGMVPKPRKPLSLADMDRAIAKGASRRGSK